MTALPNAIQTSAIYMLENRDLPIARAFINDPLNAANVGSIGGDDGITGLDGVPPREAAVVTPEFHGGVHGNFWMDRRPFTITTEIAQPSIDARNIALGRLHRACKGYTSDVTVCWFPGDPSIVPVTRINSVLNPNFEYDSPFTPPAYWTNITDGGGSWTATAYQVQAVNPLVGANALRITGTKDNNATQREIGAYTEAQGIDPSLPYSAQCSIYVNNAVASGTNWAMQMAWLDQNGTLLTGPTSSSIGSGTGRFTITMNNVTPPAYATTCRLYVFALDTSPLDVVDVMIDTVQVVQETSAGSYFDGDTANCSWLFGVRGGARSANRPNGRYITARTQQAPRQSGVGWKKGHLAAFVAADPRIYGSLASNLTGMAPATTYTIENQGDEESLPLYIQINGPGVNPTLQFIANGVTRNYAFLTTLAGGDYIGVLPRTRGVYRNGGAAPSILDLANTTWPGVMPGMNTVRTNFASGSTGASVTQIQYQDAWA